MHLHELKIAAPKSKELLIKQTLAPLLANYPGLVGSGRRFPSLAPYHDRAVDEAVYIYREISRRSASEDFGNKVETYLQWIADPIGEAFAGPDILKLVKSPAFSFLSKEVNFPNDKDVKELVDRNIAAGENAKATGSTVSVDANLRKFCRAIIQTMDDVALLYDIATWTSHAQYVIPEDDVRLVSSIARATLNKLGFPAAEIPPVST